MAAQTTATTGVNSAASRRSLSTASMTAKAASADTVAVTAWARASGVAATTAPSRAGTLIATSVRSLPGRCRATRARLPEPVQAMRGPAHDLSWRVVGGGGIDQRAFLLPRIPQDPAGRAG